MLRGLLPEMLPFMLVLVPVFLLLNTLRFHNIRKSAGYFLFACYLTALYTLVGLPNILYHRFSPNICLIPDPGIFLDLHNGFLNVLLYVPLGLFLPLLWKSFRHWYPTVRFGFCLSLVTELLQIFTLRATDINDLLTNTAGTLLGYLLAVLVIQCCPAFRRSGSSQAGTDLPLLLSVSFGLLFFLQPFLLKLVYSL